MAGIFKAYDIRGTYPDQLNEQLAEKIGIATGRLFEQGTVVVGHDMREVAEPISEALIKGLQKAGQDVLDIGLCSTPMNYSAIGFFKASGGVMVTASHNPAGYIGFKFSREEARPVAYETGINEIEQAVNNNDLPLAEQAGNYKKIEFLKQYRDIILNFAETIKPLSVVVDTGNGMGGLTVPEIFSRLPIKLEKLYFELDGSFPNHLPNPLETKNMVDLQSKVRSGNYDLGIAFDGDADRAAFVDEKGEIIPSDLLTALLVKPLLANQKEESVVYDLRSSRVVAEEIERQGGIPVRYRVGHAYMKAKMREVNAIFGGELSGHYYFRDNYYTDSGMIATLQLLNHLSTTEKPLSKLVDPLRRYAQSGEINFQVEEKEAAMEALAQQFKEAEIDRLDGITIAFKDWWFNVRPSNTEPFLRLNLEAPNQQQMKEKLNLVEGVLDSYVSTEKSS